MRTIARLASALAFFSILLVSCSKTPPKEQMPEFEPLDTSVLDRKDPGFRPFPQDDPKVRVVDGTKILDLPAHSAVLLEKGRTATEGKQIRAHYTGWTPDGKIFDDSWKTGNPATFMLAKGSLIEGWVSALVGVKEGESRMIWIPADKAYGESGRGEDIPPNTPLQFQIDLLEVLDTPAADNAIDIDTGR